MRFFIGVISLFSVVLVVAWQAGIGINVTPSLPKGIYMSVNELPVHGDIVKFCLQDKEFIKIAHDNEYIGAGVCDSNLRPLLKLVAGMPGDTICIEENGIYVTPKGKNIACVWALPRKEDSQGRAINSQLESGVIAENKVLVLTTYSGSFDSRYFGLININTVSKAVNLLSF